MYNIYCKIRFKVLLPFSKAKIVKFKKKANYVKKSQILSKHQEKHVNLAKKSVTGVNLLPPPPPIPPML